MRLAAQAKGGFYPTPPEVVDLAAGLVSVGGYGLPPGPDPAHPGPLLRGRRGPGATGPAPDPAVEHSRRDLRHRAAPGPG